MAQGVFFTGTVRCASWDEALPEATEWLSSTLALVSPHCWRLMRDAPQMTVGRAPGPRRDETDDEVRWGPDDGAYVGLFLRSSARPPRGSFVRGGWAGLRRALSRLEPGGELSVRVAPLDEHGRRPVLPLRGDGHLSVRWMQMGDEVLLELTVRVGSDDHFMDSVLPHQQAWIEVRSVHTAKAGDKVDEFESYWEDCLAALVGAPEDSLRERTDIVHGFNWLTMVPPHLAGRVRRDAADELFDVERLASGGLWLRATQDPHAYDVVAARQVRAALLDVLPAPTPEPYSPAPWLMHFRSPGSTLGDPRPRPDQV